MIFGFSFSRKYIFRKKKHRRWCLCIEFFFVTISCISCHVILLLCQKEKLFYWISANIAEIRGSKHITFQNLMNVLFGKKQNEVRSTQITCHVVKPEIELVEIDIFPKISYLGRLKKESRCNKRPLFTTFTIKHVGLHSEGRKKGHNVPILLLIHATLPLLLESFLYFFDMRSIVGCKSWPFLPKIQTLKNRQVIETLTGVLQCFIKYANCKNFKLMSHASFLPFCQNTKSYAMRF